MFPSPPSTGHFPYFHRHKGNIQTLVVDGNTGLTPDMDSVRSSSTRSEASWGRGTPQDTSPENSATSSTPKLYTSAACDTWVTKDTKRAPGRSRLDRPKVGVVEVASCTHQHTAMGILVEEQLRGHESRGTPGSTRHGSLAPTWKHTHPHTGVS